MSHLKSYLLPSFTLTARELTPEERIQNRSGYTEGRDYIAIDIRARAGGLLTCCVGSPVCGEWDEDHAVRSALSFASEPSCWDTSADEEWVCTHGEELINEALCHGVLGMELRDE